MLFHHALTVFEQKVTLDAVRLHSCFFSLLPEIGLGDQIQRLELCELGGEVEHGVAAAVVERLLGLESPVDEGAESGKHAKEKAGLLRASRGGDASLFVVSDEGKDADKNGAGNRDETENICIFCISIVTCLFTDIESILLICIVAIRSPM